MNLSKAIAAASRRGASSPADPLWANVVFLGKFHGSNGSTTFPEYTGRTISAAGNAQLSTGKALYGPSALYLDGTGDWVTVPAGAEWNFGSATDFCVEGWVWIDSTDSTGTMYCLENRSHYVACMSNTIYGGSITGGANPVFFSYTGFFNQWTHIAHTRAGSTHHLFFNGVQKATASSAASFGSSTHGMRLGSDPIYGDAKMWIDSVRVTKGNARYTANFTPGEFLTS